jgi:FdhE protein
LLTLARAGPFLGGEIQLIESVVRQGEVAPGGKWEGVLGGVKAPDPIVLPDPSKRFLNTEIRLQALVAGHQMGNWMRFMARLAHAQHFAATTLPLPRALPDSVIAEAVAARIPPLAADGHRRDASWRASFPIFGESFGAADAPIQARRAVAELQATEATEIERLADDFLRGGIDASNAASALYVAAALQVYFTRVAALLPVTSLRLLEQRGLCPSCGSAPSTGMVTATGQTPGVRYLYCSLCATAWNHVRAVCITCGDSRSISLKGIEGDKGVVKAETCDACHTYAKMIYQKQDTKADPFADDLASLGLDVVLGEAGWPRHAPNPLLLLG